MRHVLRTSTALITSLSLGLAQLPVAAIAQSLDPAPSFDPAQCREGEDEASCLARLLEEAEAAALEAARLAAEAAAAEAAAAEEAARLAAEAEAAEEAARLAAELAAAEAALAEEAARLAAEAAEADQAARLAAEAEQAEQAARLAAEAAALEEALRQAAAAEADAAAAAEEAAHLATQAAEAEAEAARASEEAARLAADEAARLAAEAEAVAEATEEAERLAAEEAARLAADEAARLAAEAEAEAAVEAEAEAETVEPPAPLAVTEPVADDPVEPAMDPAPDLEAADLAAALAAAAAAAAAAAGIAPDVLQADSLSPEEDAALEAELAAARAAAEAAELAAATPIDPVIEAETQIATVAADTEEALQSLSLQSEQTPVVDSVTEVITQDTTRSADQEFTRLLTATTDPAATESRNSVFGNMSGAQGLLLGALGGLVVGSIISGNRQVVNRADDRVVVLRPQGDYQVIRDDDVLMRRPGSSVVTESFADGSSRSVINQPDGTQVITIRDRDLRILRRTVVAPDGTRTVLIDDTAVRAPVVVSQLPPVRTGGGLITTDPSTDAAALARALAGQSAADRNFSLAQIRSIRAVRDLAPAVNLEAVTFATGSAAVTPDQASRLLALGRYMADAIARNPREVFLVEGHTDAVGSASFNLALSDRRAESVALALTEYFGVPPQNMVIQGYGEDFLLIPTLENERLNRRVAVRRITDLLRVAAAP
jgi:outer membrane protein OmpA-like peptidoglycan-associated protein